MTDAAPTSAATSRLPAAWWAPGLALHERVGRTLPTTADDAGRARLSAWRARYADAPDTFVRRLAAIGLTEDALLGLLTETSAALAARVPRPSWPDLAERAVDRAERAAREPSVPPPADWRAAFAGVLRPLVDAATAEEFARLGPRLAAAQVDVAAVTGDFAAVLGRKLVRLAARTLVAEAHQWRAAGRLAGLDGTARFADFVRQLSAPDGLSELFCAYPVLARMLAQTAAQDTRAWVELLIRFADDRADLVATVLGGVDPGELRAVSGNQGDVHQHGRAVRLLSFADGATVVYKPRDIEPQLRLAELIGWLNLARPGLAMRTPIALARDGYGWTEFVAHTPITEPAGITVFYQRLGALLALLHTVRATDMHYQNVIACGDQPIVVDAETLFHPLLSIPQHTADPAARALAASVARVGLLPSIEVGEDGVADFSAVGGHVASVSAHGATVRAAEGTDQMRPVPRPAAYLDARNQPSAVDVAIDPADHLDAFRQGFRDGYRTIEQHRAEFAGLVERCAGLRVRVVVRPTRGYVALLDESYRPEFLRDGLDRDQVFDALWTEAAADPVRWRTAPYEAVDLWAGDVPLFHGRPDATGLYASTGEWLASALEGTGGRRAADTIAGLSEPDRRDQEWIIRAAMATRLPRQGHARRAAHRDLTPVAAQPERLLAAACAVADQLVASAVTDEDRVNWLGLELVDERQWLVLPMGGGLANGYLGVALFLAQLSAMTGIHRYADVAYGGVRAYRRLHQSLGRHPELAAAVGCGGLHGLGGIAYALGRLAVLLDDADTATLGVETVGLAEVAVGPASGHGWADGLAGCLAAMTAVHADLGLESAGRLALRCADLLVGGGYRASLGPGFAAGAAGVAFGLSRVADVDARYLAAARSVRRGTESSPADFRGPDPGWWSGAAGRLLAHGRDVPPAQPGTDAMLRALAARPVSADLSLCHGELGIVDGLSFLPGPGAVDQLSGAEIARHRAGLVLDAISRFGPTCGTPDAVPTPGLLHGLAGIGYGLLRLGFPAEVPSVLRLEPGPARPYSLRSMSATSKRR